MAGIRIVVYAGEPETRSSPTKKGLAPLPLTGRNPGQLPSGRHDLSREFVVRSQQTRIVDALAKVVARDGYPNTSVSSVLKEAGVSRATFYEHYRSKEDCFNTAFAAIAEGLTRRVEEAYAEHQDWTEGVGAALRRFLEVLASEPEMARMCMVESLSVGPVALDIFRGTLDRFAALLEDAVAGADEPVPDELVRALVGGLSSVVYREILAGRTKELPDRLPSLLFFVIAPLRGRAAARAAADAAAA
jgi:AcrR family transcriptional regulator